MQTLDYDLNDTKKHHDYPVPNGFTGVPVSVADGKEDVVLTVDGREVSLSAQGARDLALALRQSANRIEKIRREFSLR